MTQVEQIAQEAGIKAAAQWGGQQAVDNPNIQTNRPALKRAIEIERNKYISYLAQNRRIVKVQTDHSGGVVGDRFWEGVIFCPLRGPVGYANSTAIGCRGEGSFKPSEQMVAKAIEILEQRVANARQDLDACLASPYLTAHQLQRCAIALQNAVADLIYRSDKSHPGWAK